MIFVCLTCFFTKCGKEPVIPDALHYCLITKLFCTFILNIICLILAIVLIKTALTISSSDVQFYQDNTCIAYYINHQVRKFKPFYDSVETNVIIIFIGCFLQNVYEGLIYPSIRFGWIKNVVELDNAGRTPYKPKITV